MPYSLFKTTLGECAVQWGDHGITAFHLSSARLNSSEEIPVTDTDAPPFVTTLIQRVQDHLAGRPQDFSNVYYDFSTVSPFQKSIYIAALEVKSGSTRTYGWLAAAIGQPPAVSRAIGTALGQNPWPLLVPCHRFIGADGKMTGYSGPGGIPTKLKLLALEGAELFAE